MTEEYDAGRPDPVQYLRLHPEMLVPYYGEYHATRVPLWAVRRLLREVNRLNRKVAELEDEVASLEEQVPPFPLRNL